MESHDNIDFLLLMTCRPHIFISSNLHHLIMAWSKPYQAILHLVSVKYSEARGRKEKKVVVQETVKDIRARHKKEKFTEDLPEGLSIIYQNY